MRIKYVYHMHSGGYGETASSSMITPATGSSTTISAATRTYGLKMNFIGIIIRSIKHSSCYAPQHHTNQQGNWNGSVVYNNILPKKALFTVAQGLQYVSVGTEARVLEPSRRAPMARLRN